MQCIHPVSPEETTVAEGCYVYHCNGETLDIEEPFSIHEKQAGHMIIRSQRQSAAHGTNMLVHSEHRDAVITRVQMQWQNQPNGQAMAFCDCRASYDIETAGIRVQREWRDSEGELIDQNEDTLSTSFEFVTSPLMRVYVGPVIHQINRHGGKAFVLVPWIKDPSDQQQLFKPSMSGTTSKISW